MVMNITTFIQIPFHAATKAAMLKQRLVITLTLSVPSRKIIVKCFSLRIR